MKSKSTKTGYKKYTRDKGLSKIYIFLAVFVALSFPTVQAQVNGYGDMKPKAGQSLDRIVAIVGDEVVMQSDIDGELAQAMMQNPNLDPSDITVRKEILDLIINQKLKIAQAIKDSIEVSNDDVDMRWNQALMGMKQRYGSEARIEEIYGKPISTLRYEYRDEIKNSILAERLTQMKMMDIEVSPIEVTNFYEEYKDSLAQIPEKPIIRHLVKYLGADTETKEKAKKRALMVRDSIIAGADFGVMASNFSEDPGTRTAEGSLGWTKKGSLVPEYEKAAYSLQVGEISQPVESPFGYHVIRLDGKRVDEVNTSHILIKIEQSQSSKESTYSFLSSIEDSLNAGISFETLVERYSEDKTTVGYGGMVDQQQFVYFSSDAKLAVDKLGEGELSKPFIYTQSPTKPAYHIIYKEEVVPAHKPSPEQDYLLLKQMATMKKRQELLQEWSKELRENLYWEITVANP
ncbi:MAG: peptidylprolyl isomerase [Candidatus Kapaibacteriales bacterium]